MRSPSLVLDYVLDILYRCRRVVINRDGNKVKLNVVPYVVHRAVGHGTTTQRAPLLLVDAVVCRLPAPFTTCLNLHKVQGVEVLGYDIHLVVANPPVALHDIVAPLTQPLGGNILATSANLGLNDAHYFERLSRNSMLSPGCTSYVSTPFLKMRIEREPISSMPLSSMRSIQPSRKPTT